MPQWSSYQQAIFAAVACGTGLNTPQAQASNQSVQARTPKARKAQKAKRSKRCGGSEP